MTALKHNSDCRDTTTLLDQTLVSLLNSPKPICVLLIKLTLSKNPAKSLLSKIPDHT